ncbi:MAG: YdeI/OmpD-associated family protein [Candidatus Nanoarchaeia archaeon]|nr:YdeI/OmpD-associated family protein [Candidatus Nanoarchaeia archaeon]MDD5740680.1 YdeI/OmpD-associated family protein [Candidatus Nanoarchaeia archaeon]
MKISKTLYVTEREKWRAWLAKNHNKEKDIWLIYYKKSSGKPRIAYNDAVEEALCYGWIDSIIKRIDKKKFAQRFSQRRPDSILSEMNRERIKNLIKNKQMTKFGMKAIRHVFNKDSLEKFIIPKDILNEIRKDRQAWKNFQNFSESYRRIRIAYIEDVRTRRKKEFKKRLNNFIKMTRKNRQFGFVKEMIKK